jgi:glycerol-3-phosphate dehydrogenase
MVDVLVIGGGINGAGIARDAAGRGLSVTLVERGDLGNATSSASSKLIHGGLRYLEQYEFRLVAEALAERETLLRVAGHLTWPTRFVMPHVPELRPRWMIRTGLFLYDHLARRSLLPGSTTVRLDAPPWSSGLRAGLRHGFAYSDCRVDDARLVVCTAMDARARGATILTRTECIAARREGDGWIVRLAGGRDLRARAIVNAAGPWVKGVLNDRLDQPSADSVRLVRGSHIVTRKRYEGEHAFILQNDDRRVIFMIPYEQAFTLIGTTDVAEPGAEPGPGTEDEVEYLCRAVNRYLAQPLSSADVVWRYWGTRPLYDDGTTDPSAVTRDYTLRIDDSGGKAPVLSVFGGKLTTYRRLAEHALEKLRAYFPEMRGSWTDAAPVPGSAFDDRESALARAKARYARLPAEVVDAVFRRHGSLTAEVLGDGEIGVHYGAGLTERELHYLREREWAMTGEDVLWRRTKAGLHLQAAAQRRVAEAMGAA